jgi:hypothetical protein
MVDKAKPTAKVIKWSDYLIDEDSLVSKKLKASLDEALVRAWDKQKKKDKTPELPEDPVERAIQKEIRRLNG